MLYKRTIFVVRVAKNVDYVDAFQWKTHSDYFAMTNYGNKILLSKEEETKYDLNKI